MRRLLIIALAAVVGCTPAPPENPGPFDAEGLAMSIKDQEAKLLAELPDHPFWKVPVTTAQISDLADRMRADQGGAVFLIDDHFQIVAQHRAGIPTTVKGRHIEINVADYHARPSRVRLLIKLKTQLDAEEVLAR